MVSREEVLKLAKLSKLSLEENEIEIYQKDLNDVFVYIESLNELDLENVEPLYNVLEISLKVHKDEVKEEVTKKDFLSQAPKSDENFVSLPIMVGGSYE